MALDYGRRRIGVATSDPTLTIATPHSVVRNSPPPVEPPAELVSLLAELEPSLILVGIPVHMDGSEGEMAAEARRFGRRVAELTGVRVLEADERLTTADADELLREIGPARRGRERERRDMVAAALLLRDYLGGR